MSPLQVARAGGLNYQHVIAIANGREPLTSSDAAAIEQLTGAPVAWLRNGWPG